MYYIVILIALHIQLQLHCSVISYKSLLGAVYTFEVASLRYVASYESKFTTIGALKAAQWKLKCIDRIICKATQLDMQDLSQRRFNIFKEYL